MSSVLKIVLGVLYVLFICYYFLSEYKKGKFEIKNWIAGRGQFYFGIIFLGIIAFYVIISELRNLIQ